MSSIRCCTIHVLPPFYHDLIFLLFYTFSLFLTTPSKDSIGNNALHYVEYEEDENSYAIIKMLENPAQIIKRREQILGADIAGTVFGNISTAGVAYGLDKFNTPRGHGFAAERANTLYDKLTGHDAQIIGDDNAVNGADRLVDGVYIQSKYCASGGKCISEYFDKNGQFRYYNADGSTMQIEVPSDMYDAAVQSMQERIKKGQIKNVTDPSKAREIVRKGHYTYEQAKNIAKAGNFDSIKFDATNGMVVGAWAGGISGAISFAQSIWNGENFDVALKNASLSFIRVGGTTAVVTLVSSQISKAGMNSLLVGSTDAIISVIGPKASAILVNAFRSGGNIYGAAAMKSASKLLRGNVITAAVATAVLSSVDVVNIFRGRISGAQLFKNFTTTAASVAGGTAGWVGGAAAGAAVGSFIPIIGTTIGGVVGGLLGAFGGGSVAGDVTKSVLDGFVEDDANEMVRIIQSVFEQLAGDYLLNKKEAENIVDRLQNRLDGSKLKDMYASSSRRSFAERIIRPLCEDEIKKRKTILLPDNKTLLSGVRNALEDIAEAEPQLALA